MAETTTDVLVAGYQDIDEATKDFDALVALIKDKKVSIEGVILVTHAEDGSVAVRQTGDHMGRKGMGWGGGVGLAVGMFAPPLLAAVGVGAVAGGVIGKFVDHRVKNQIHDNIGENLPPGSAGIIAVFDHEQRLGVEQALQGAALRSIVPSDKEGMARIEGVPRRGDGEVQPGPNGAANRRPKLRWDDRSDDRFLGCRLDDQYVAFATRGRAEYLARTDRRRGIWQSVDFRRPRGDAGYDAPG